jgi:hypothetical protein
MAYENVSQISARYEDGFFETAPVSLQPRILVLGTASDGRTDQLWNVASLPAAVREFKGYGTLIRGMYEVRAQGAENVSLRRLATGTPGILTGICSDIAGSGITIETIQEDSDVGTRYSLWFDATTGRIAIYDTEDEEWIYDTEEVLAIDAGLIAVSGSCTIGEGVSIGSMSSPVAFEDCPALDAGVIVWTDGTDGLNPSKMALYEALDLAYEDLDWIDVDFIVPMNATLDCVNVADLSDGQITARGLAGVTDYPTAGAQTDVLGLMYRESYQGQWYYWWDVDGDGVAEIFPSVGSASGTATISGRTLVGIDFHEVNFAYQAADFSRKASETWHTCIAFVGVEAPASFSTSALAAWIGDLPTYTTLDDGSSVVSIASHNGTGLLGNKFLAGKNAFRGSTANGGFIQTEDGFLDSGEVSDTNDHLVDIGKHLIVVAPFVIHLNRWVNPDSGTGRPAEYIASLVTSAAGKYATLPEKEEANGPNGLLTAVRIIRKTPGRLLNQLVGVRYMAINALSGVGTILCGSKTTARPDSDWRKISTIRSVNRELQGIRNICAKYQGKELSVNNIASMQTAVDGFLRDERELGYNLGARAQFLSTPALRRLGQLTCHVQIVPPFALEVVDVSISLADDESGT